MKKVISSILILFAIAMMIHSNFSKAQNKIVKPTSINIHEKGIVVLELFTSQGCSSCPPADKVLAKYVLRDNPNIIPLAFHVDYWNYIGWKDPFSRAEYSERQQKYAAYFNSNGVYTPQLVINGKYELIGNQEKTIEKIVNEQTSISTADKIEINSTFLNQNKIVVKYEVKESRSNKTVNIALVKKKEFTSIKRGENKGLQQTSYNIVYDFKSVVLHNIMENQVTFNFQNNWSASDFIVVAYIQDSLNGKIFTATKKEIN